MIISNNDRTTAGGSRADNQDQCGGVGGDGHSSGIPGPNDDPVCVGGEGGSYRLVHIGKHDASHCSRGDGNCGCDRHAELHEGGSRRGDCEGGCRFWSEHEQPRGNGGGDCHLQEQWGGGGAMSVMTAMGLNTSSPEETEAVTVTYGNSGGGGGERDDSSGIEH